MGTGHARTPVAIALAIAGVGLAGCSVEESLDIPYCNRGSTSLIAVQSVPTASQIPCLEDLDDNWEAVSVHVDHDGTIVILDSEDAGEDAAILRFEESCDISEASERVSGFDDVERYDHVDQLLPSFRGSRYYVFDGGCAWWRFTFANDIGVDGADALGEHLQFFPRAIVNENFANSFMDEDL